MIDPDTYKRMLGRRDAAMMVAEPGPDVGDMMPDPGDRLEAAIDEALALEARDCFEEEGKEGWEPLAEGPCIRIPLAWLRPWLGVGRSRCSRRNWTKDRVVRLLDADVAARYVSAGWGAAEARYDSARSQSIVFTFLTRGEVAAGAEAEAERCARDAREKSRIHREDMERREHDSLQGRGADAMFELGELLGVGPKRFAHPLRFYSNDDMRGMVEYLEDLRSSAWTHCLHRDPEGGRQGDDIMRRGDSALAGLGDALGVARRPGGRESAVGYLEDMLLAARLMRFDLDMTRLDGADGGGAQEDAGFEGPPDEGFGDG